MGMIAKIEIINPVDPSKRICVVVNGGSVTQKGVEIRPFEKNNDLDNQILRAINNLEDVLLQAIEGKPVETKLSVGEAKARLAKLQEGNHA